VHKIREALPNEDSKAMKVLIVYYSTYGHVYRMATLVAEGVKEIPGVEPVVRTVPELIPKSVIDAREDMKSGREMQSDVPFVTIDDFREAGAIALVRRLVSETYRHNSRTKSTRSRHSGSREHWKASQPGSLFLPPAYTAGRKQRF
jgi:hypothetical protein